MLRNYGGAPRGQIVRLQGRAAQVAAALGLQYTGREISNLVYKYGPRVIEHLRSQARNPGTRSSIQRRFGPGNIQTPDMIAPRRRKYVGPASGGGKRLHFGNGAVAGYQQLSYAKRVYGKKKKTSVIKNLVRQARESQVNYIGRWQSLTSPMPTSASLLAVKSGVYRTEGGIIYSPLYAFNLSSPAQMNNSAGNPVYTCPMYRLFKNSTVTASSKAWSWVVTEGVRNHKDGVTNQARWNMEHYEGNIVRSENYSHDWSHIRLMLQGTTKYPIRYHIYLVKFLADGLGPERYCRNNLDTAYVKKDTDTLDEHDMNEFDYFWERFMEPKITHAFANTKKTGLQTRKHLAVLKHEVVNIGSEVTISADVQPLQHIHNIFYRNGRIMNTMDAQAIEATLPVADTGVGIGTAGKVGFASTGTNPESDVFPERKTDVWCLVCPEVYVYTGPGLTTPVSESVENTPSFDVSVRSKYTFYPKA